MDKKRIVVLQFTLDGNDLYTIPEDEFEEWTLGRLMDEVSDIAMSQGETPDEIPPSQVEMRFAGMDVPAEEGRVGRDKQFYADMKAAGLKVSYHETEFYRGFAVFTRDLQATLRATAVPCYWQVAGIGFWVYPEEE